MFEKRMQRAAMALLVAALLLAAPLQAAGWSSRETPGLLEAAWSWLAEWLTGTTQLRPATEADEAPVPPTGQPGGETPPGPGGDDGGGIDPDG